MMVWKGSKRVINIAAGVHAAAMASYQEFNFFGEMSTFDKSNFGFVIAGSYGRRVPVRSVIEGAKAIPERAAIIRLYLRKGR